jgi:hypothetical protein
MSQHGVETQIIIIIIINLTAMKPQMSNNLHEYSRPPPHPPAFRIHAIMQLMSAPRYAAYILKSFFV